MRLRTSLLFGLLVAVAPAAYGQEAQQPEPETQVAMTEVTQGNTTLQQRLMPETAATLLAPATTEARTVDAESDVANTLQRRGSGTGLIIAGGALFVAGLLIGDDAGTVLAVAGAAIGAYGLYLYFM